MIKSYLTNKLQQVRINNYISKAKEINTGVPQGTILGPLFFILYVNEMLITLGNREMISYADDKALLSTAETWDEAQNKMNERMDIVVCWLGSNKLSLNVGKTVFITFGIYCDSVPDNET